MEPIRMTVEFEFDGDALLDAFNIVVPKGKYYKLRDVCKHVFNDTFTAEFEVRPIEN